MQQTTAYLTDKACTGTTVYLVYMCVCVSVCVLEAEGERAGSAVRRRGTSALISPSSRYYTPALTVFIGTETKKHQVFMMH